MADDIEADEIGAPGTSTVGTAASLVLDDPIDDLPIAIAEERLSPRERLDEVTERLATEDAEDGSGSSRSGIWAVGIVTLLIGLAGGFSGAYLLKDRMRPETQAQATPGAARPAPALPVETVHDYTERAVEGAVGDPPRNAATASPAAGVPSVPAAAPPAPNATKGNGKTVDPVTATEPKPSAERAQVPAHVPSQVAQSGESGAVGRLLVRSSPADARVFLDGQEQGMTPATFRDLATGVHELRVVREGYVPEERRVVITPARPAQSVSIDLERVSGSTTRAVGEPTPLSTPDTAAMGALDIDSKPPGAQVFLDGTLVGTTPFVSTRVGAGRHAVRIEHSGYRGWASSVWIVQGGRNRITASLER